MSSARNRTRRNNGVKGIVVKETTGLVWDDIIYFTKFTGGGSVS